ncbi:glycosyltransferase family 39 protein [Candidatus Sumerlaeota bacterium]|nr:glycosyltransferase family 39 protein [Candidatus Sumerlaeota bacterium]
MERKYKILALWVAVFGLLLRVVWFGYGLPHPGYYSSDEIDTVSRTLKIATGDLAPSHFNKPTFYNLTILPFYGMSFGLFRLIGLIFTREDFIRIFIQRPCIFYWFPRLISAFAGTLSILLVYHIGKRIRDRETGLFAAIILAVCYTSAQYCHIAKEDALMTLLILASLFFSVKTMEKKPLGAIVLFFLSSIFAGLAAATKYTGIVSLLFPFLFFISGMRDKKGASTILGIFVIPTGFLMGFCLGTPYAFLHPSDFMKGVYSSTILQQIKGETVWLGGVKHYGLSFILMMFITEFGILLTAAGCASFCYLAFLLIGNKHSPLLEKSNHSILNALIVFSIFYLLILFFSGHLDHQYIMPLSPIWALYVSLTISYTAKPKLHIIKPVFILMLIAQPLYSSLKFDLETTGKDTRIQAAQWIEDNIPPHEKIIFDTDYYYQYHPPLRFVTGAIRELKHEALEKGGTGQFFDMLEEHQKNDEPLYNARFLPMPTWMERLSDDDIRRYNLAKIREDGFQWVVISGYYFKRILEDKNPGWDPIRRFYIDLQNNVEEKARFQSASWKSHGPEIVIYKLGDGS